MTDDDPNTIAVRLDDAPDRRLDKALAAVVPAELGLSRSRITALIHSGAVKDQNGTPCRDPKKRPQPGASLFITLPAPEPIEAQPEDIPLEIHFEDDHLIVVNKPAGMVVHPAPGAATGTLVNALLHHCRDSLSGIGGAERPGIVHRIDKDTSGLLVVAKSDLAHQALAEQFADHSVTRRYLAVCWGIPSVSDPRLMGLLGVSADEAAQIRIDRPLARHRADRKKMAVQAGGKHAVTHLLVMEPLGARCALISCRLETGRTHQIRVHLAYAGHPLVGDPVYGRQRSMPDPMVQDVRISGFRRQALHAQTLGFLHPESGESLLFEAMIPLDMSELIEALKDHETL